MPVSDFFWGGFIERWRKELGLPADASPYYHYDLDWIVTVPNMDPWIRPFETIQGNAGRGGGQDRLRGHHAEGVPLPDAGVHRLGDRHAGEARSGRVRRSARPAALLFRLATIRSPAWATVSSGTRRRGSTRSSRSGPTFPVYGSITECSECMTRMIGPQNHLMWIALGAGADGRRAASRRRVLSRMRQGGHRRGRAVARRLRDLGRRGLQEEHVHAPRLLATSTTSRGSRRSSITPTRRDST